MRKIAYQVQLKPAEKDFLHQVINRSAYTGKQVKRASILLSIDEQGQGLSNKAAAALFGISTGYITLLRKEYLKKGAQGVIELGKHGPKAPKKVFGEQEAHLIALACSQDWPQGRNGWTLKLLAKRMVELEYIEAISSEKVRQVLKKKGFGLGRRNNG